MSATDYGRYYWCVRTNQSKDGEVYLHADTGRVDTTGALVFSHIYEDGDDHPTLVFAPGEWSVFFAASVMDGHAVAVEHWQGEIADGRS